jgi:hypothetical protein
VKKNPELQANGKEEQLKDKILDIFFNFINEQSPDRRQAFIGQLWEQTIKWYGKYLSVNAYEMGNEIFGVIRRITKEESNVPQEKIDFFKFLGKSLKNAEVEYYRSFESGAIKIPKAKMSKYKEADYVLRLIENKLGRKPTYNECSQSIENWFKKDKYTYEDHLKIKNSKQISNLDIFDMVFKTENNLNDSCSENLLSLKTEKIKEAINHVLETKQQRVQNRYKALVTLYFIENEELYPVLDREIINAYQKDGIKPKQYEIYQKFKPQVTKDSAEATASKMLKDFLNDLETYLKEKIQRFSNKTIKSSKT